jgi:ATP-dependent DNA helicase RecG
VKEKSDDELLDHYQLAQGPNLTNLGVLSLGRHHHRAQLTTAPVIQFIKYDEHGQKVNKLVWDDHTQSPMELIEAVWQEVPDFRERYELPDGLYRRTCPLSMKSWCASYWSTHWYIVPTPSAVTSF